MIKFSQKFNSGRAQSPMAGNRNLRYSNAQIDEVTTKELRELPSSPKSYPASDWLSIFTGTKRPYKCRISSGDPTSNLHRSRESRSEFNRVSNRLPNLKTPSSNPLRRGRNVTS
ncbi:hypothetical protein AVEN_225791-1 [Araneus ventricosus]|uniref:Uncharacterized protein n=1 Tax=Araneus ventricosus TaxID=182803 RepID=A0A4Y2BCZ6_ARAVE|nr:hypothetical protein AVEN_225791-1 [Araneus ventricosus]